MHKLTSGRAHVTDPTNASRTMLYDIERAPGTTSCCGCFGVPREVLPEVRPSSGMFGVADARWFGREIPDRGDRGRPAGRALRPGVRHAGQRQEHLRHRRFPPAQHRLARVRSTHGLLTTVALRCARRARLRARRLGLHRGRHRAVAARRPRHHRHRRGDGAAGPLRRGHRRRRVRARASSVSARRTGSPRPAAPSSA